MLGVGDKVRAVLLVDDDEVMLRAAVRTLHRDRAVFVATNANQAVQIAAEKKLDLAIVDCFLGNESGIDLIRALKRQTPQILVVLSSGLMSYGRAVEALRAGAHDVALKPFAVNDVIRRIESPSECATADEIPSLDRVEWEHIQRVVEQCKGNLSRAARCLGINRSTLKRKLRKLPSRQ